MPTIVPVGAPSASDMFLRSSTPGRRDPRRRGSRDHPVVARATAAPIADVLAAPVMTLLELALGATEPRAAVADGAPGVATGRVELPTFRFSVERSTN